MQLLLPCLAAIADIDGDGMLYAILRILLVGLVCVIVWVIAKRFAPPDVLWIVGLILLVLFLIYALSAFGIFV